jgi:Putative zinc-finger
MNCEEVRISLHDYVDEQLDRPAKKAIEDHLRDCDACYKEITRLKNYFNLLNSIPYSIEGPKEIIQKFSQELLAISHEELGEKGAIYSFEDEKLRKEQNKLEKKLKLERGASRKSRVSRTITRSRYDGFGNFFSFDWKRIIIIPLLLVAGLTGYFLYDMQKYNSPWDLQATIGTIVVNGRQNTTGKISQGESLSLDKGSNAVIQIPNTGKVEVNSNSYIVLEEAKNGANRIRVKEGLIRVVNTSDLPDLRIAVNDAIILDMNGIFTVDIDVASNAKIVVDKGFLEIRVKGETYYVANGYVCEIKNNHRPGTPYRVEAADTLKKEVEKFDYFNGGDISVQNIISVAQAKDMLTLLAMMTSVSQLQRQILFQVIANHFPPPTSVTRLGIMKGDSEMLYRWWEEIEWQI